MKCSATTHKTNVMAAHRCEHEREVRLITVGPRRAHLCAFHRAALNRGDRVIIKPK